MKILSIFSQPIRSHAFIFLLCVMTSVSCSMRKFALEYHEFFSTRIAVSFLDLDHEQKNQFRKQWQVFSARVATAKIEPMATSIETLGDSSDPFSSSEYLQKNIREVLAGACTDFSSIAVSLRPTQIKNLQEKINDRNDTFDPDHNGGLLKHRKQKQKELLESIDKWLGGANAAQKKLISDTDKEKDPDGRWERNYLAYSREAQSIFISMMQSTAGDAQAFEKKCSNYMVDPDSLLSETARTIKVDLKQSRQKTLTAIFQTIDPIQREHLKKETNKLAKDLRSWANDVIAK